MKTKITIIPVKCETSYIPGHAPHVAIKGQRLLHIAGTSYYHHVGAVPRGQSGRQVMHGPLVEGPWAYAFGKCGVISDCAASNARDRAEYKGALEVKEGSLVDIDGVVYSVKIVRRAYIDLVKEDQS